MVVHILCHFVLVFHLFFFLKGRAILIHSVEFIFGDYIHGLEIETWHMAIFLLLYLAALHNPKV